MICYFDNAATTFPKPKAVTAAVNECISYYCGNPGRSSHSLSVKCSEKIYEARESVARLLSFANPENISFTQNATHALNIAIKGLIKERCHVIISDLEHNSVLRPVKKQIELYGGEMSVFDSDLAPEVAIEPLIRPDTRFIITTLCSNVTGRLIDISSLERVCKRHSLRLIVDASQYLGHHRIDMSVHRGIDVLCAPGHKGLFGIQGSGFIMFNNGTISADTLTEGGSGSGSLSDRMPEHLPDRFEAGTPATPSIISLGEGVKFLLEYGMPSVEARMNALTERVKDILLSVGGVKIYGCESGICSFNIDGYTSEEVSARLDKSSICVRGGLHCAPLAHKKLGTLGAGAVRISVSVLNTEKELDRLYFSLKKL
ncbi:MAG: aminotransferase class V-fold PLP-dependent enzyme [Clostridia bacterium]|nr:aminotransferase class V-fold PLP-dependent enzyme [Clostridia bacterium]